MADKNNTSSLLEAIKNKLSKFDNKPKPENKSSVNYFSQDLKNNDIDGNFVDKTNIELIFDVEKKLDNSAKMNKKIQQKAEEDYQKNLDLDLDDESLDVKNLGQKISIESKIKEIADELNLEEFEDDFEAEEIQEDNEKKDAKNINEAYKNLDPIDIELMELENEVNKNNQQKSQKISDEKTSQQIEEDLNLKTYLDSKFEDEFKEIEEKIQTQKSDLPPSNYQALQTVSADLNSNFSLKQIEDKVILNMTPAQDFLASISNKTSNENPEDPLKKPENFEEKQEIKQEIKLEEKQEIKQEVINQVSVNLDLYKNTIPDQDFLLFNSKNIEDPLKKPENFEEKPEVKNQIFAESSPTNNNENDAKITATNEEILPEKHINNKQNEEILRQDRINNSKQIDSKNLEATIEKSEVDQVILEKINYNLIREETVYQASNSMKKLMEAKNLVNNIGKFSQDESLTKIAMNLMEPKLEKWLNDNLPELVENIVREEIEKIVPKN